MLTLFFVDQKSLPHFFLSDLGLKERKIGVAVSEVNSQYRL